jgi:hypothetical protein
LTSCTIHSTDSSNLDRSVSCRIRSRACCMALFAGQRARKVTYFVPVRAHARQPVMKSEEIQALTADLEMHDARLGLFGFQPQLGQQVCQPPEGGLGLLSGRAHHDRVVGIAHQNPMLARLPCPIDEMQVDIREQRRRVRRLDRRHR